MLFLPLTHKDLHAHLHSLTSVESKGYGQNNCVWKIIGNKDFFSKKGKTKLNALAHRIIPIQLEKY